MPSKIRKAGGAKIRKYPVRPYKKPDLSKGPTPPIAPKEFREEPLDTGQKYLLAKDVGSRKVDKRTLPSGGFAQTIRRRDSEKDNIKAIREVDVWRASPGRKDDELRRRDRENRMSPTQRVDRRKKEQKEREREAAARAKQAERTRAWRAERQESRQRQREAEQEVEERNRAFREKMKGRKQ